MSAGRSVAVQDVDAASVMGLFPTRPRLLAMGEPTHGENTLLEVRNDLFRQLVEQAGYRTIALESDCLMGLVVDDYVRSGAGTLDGVMERGFSHGWGAYAGNRELVAWMRAHNDGRPAAEHVRFSGFDGPLEMMSAASPRPVLTALRDFLAARVQPDLMPAAAESLDRLVGADDRWTDPAAMMDPSRSVGRTPDAQQLRICADDLVALLDAQAPHVIAASSREDWHRARLLGRTAVGLLRYHAAMADSGPRRLTRLSALRDALMAGHLLALVEQGPVLAFAHNGHLQRDQSSMRMGGERLRWWSAGALVDARLGADYGLLATALGTIRGRDVDVPPRGTLEGLLYALPHERGLVDARELAAALAPAPPETRVSPWFGYAPLDPAHVADVDGIVFVRDA